MKLGSAVLLLFLSPCFAQAPKPPDVDAQRAAMKKLGFLVGQWSGEDRVYRGPGEPLELNQTEDARYKLDGLVLLIEGTGSNKSDGKALFRALATVSYDDGAGVYHMRAYNNGRYLETELKLADTGEGFTWGFAFGQVKTNYVMRIDEKGQWTEVGEMTMGTQPPRKIVELTVHRQK
jgi:hypothetical protein